MKKKLIVLTGPTAVGKTDLSIKLCKKINGEVISADSMQVYKRMDIGSAKISEEEKDSVTHHLIDCLEPSEDFNVFLFQKMAKEALSKIYNANHIPVLVGGTGFYIQALLYDIDFKEEPENDIRLKYEKLAEDRGESYIYDLLCQKDPEYAQSLHPNNIRKVIRALEYIEINNSKFSVHNSTQRQKESEYDFRYFVLNDNRQNIYDNIDKRVDLMIQKGLVDEVSALKSEGLNKNNISMQGLGYKEILDYLDNKCSLQEAVDTIKLQTRHFAKRQLTWFRRERDVIWINKPDFEYDKDRILDYMMEKIYDRQ